MIHIHEVGGSTPPLPIPPKLIGQAGMSPNNMDYYLIIYFFAGIFQDFLLTLNWRFIVKEKVILAAIFSFLTTVVTMVVLYNILTRLDSQRSIIAIIVYALGIGIGTILAMKAKIGS